MSRHPTTKVPARLIPCLLANKRLKRIDLRGIWFCTFAMQEESQAQPELYPGCPIGRPISAHQNLRSILFDKAMFHPHLDMHDMLRLLGLRDRESISNTPSLSHNIRPSPQRMVRSNVSRLTKRRRRCPDGTFRQARPPTKSCAMASINARAHLPL